MGKIKLSIVVLIILMIISGCQSNRKRTIDLRSELSSTLITLDKALLKLQITDKSDSNFGAIKCVHCNVLHTRAAETVYPFAVAYKITNDKKYLRAAINLGNWLIHRQENNGSWKETPEEWTGTTTDQLLMMTLAYPILKKNLPLDLQKSWIKSIKAAADYLYDVMKPEFASINYVATTSASLAAVYNLLKEEKYLLKAKKLAHRTISKMDEDGFIMGRSEEHTSELQSH